MFGGEPEAVGAGERNQGGDGELLSPTLHSLPPTELSAQLAGTPAKAWAGGGAG